MANHPAFRVHFAEQFYWPEGWAGAEFPREVTTYLATRGWDVTVFCGSEQYIEDDAVPAADPRRVGVRIKRVPRCLPGEPRGLKALRQIWFCLAVIPRLLFSIRPDVYVTQTNPPLVVPLIAAIARCRRRPYVIIAQDLYPEVLFAYGLLQRDAWAGRMLQRIFKWAYAGARRVISLGPAMSARLISKGVPEDRIEIIANWSTGDSAPRNRSSNPLRNAWGLEGHFTLVYSGNIGAAHEVETAIRAMRAVNVSYPRVVLLFVGGGARVEEAKSLVRELGLTGVVQFRPLVPTANLAQMLDLADVALVTLQPHFDGLVVPSKVYGLLARGIPVVYVGPPADVSILLSESGAGFSVSAGDCDAFAALVVRLIADPTTLSAAGSAGRTFYERNLTKAMALARYEAAVTRSAGTRKSD